MRKSWLLFSSLLLVGLPRVAAAQEGDAVKISFEDAVKRAIENNPTARVADEEIKRAEALREQVRASWLPVLTGNGVYTHLDSDRVLNGNVIQGADSLNLNLQATIPIISAKNWAAHARAKENREIQKSTTGDIKKQVALSAGRAYLTVLAQHRLLDTVILARDNAKAHEDFSKQRLDGGVGNRLDFVRASQERATSESQVRSQQITLARAQEQFGQIIGVDHPVDVTGEAQLQQLPTLDGALGEIDKKRLDVVAQKQRTESARKAVRDAYTDYLPLLNAVGQGFYQDPATLTTPKTGWQVQLVLAIPLYDGGLRYGQEHERDALYEENKARLDGVLRQARSDVRLAFETVRRADEALEQARSASKLANEARELTDLAYKAGATSNIEVIDAERRARDADTSAVIAEDTARQARLDLLAACGRFPEGIAKIEGSTKD